MKAIFTAGANRDVESILEYYLEEAGAEVASDFHSELKTVVQRIKEMPEAFPTIHGELHRAILKRFPYQVLFKIQSDNKIRILVVRHHKRNPDFGLDR